MPPRRGRAAAATSVAAPLDETHNNENEAAPARSKQAPPTATKAAAQNANAAPSFSTPKLALRTFSRRKPAAEVRKRGWSLDHPTQFEANECVGSASGSERENADCLTSCAILFSLRLPLPSSLSSVIDRLSKNPKLAPTLSHSTTSKPPQRTT